MVELLSCTSCDDLMIDQHAVRQWLDEEWKKALAEDSTDPDDEIDPLVNSTVVSIRYALVSQILGKIADPRRSLLALQLGEGVPGAWDARSFSTAVVVPWVADSNNVLGTSPEPYANKPLRRERLERGMRNVRNKAEWELLVTLLESLDSASSEKLRATFRRILRSLVRRLASQSFSYAIPPRIAQPRLAGILDAFLAVPSGGLRPHAITAALMRTVGEATAVFSRVETQGINEADSAGGVPGDVICYCGDEPERICLVVEVKDQNLTLAHVRASSLKAKQAGQNLSNLLFAARGIREQDRERIDEVSRQEWASGMNIYTVTIGELVNAVFVLLTEDWRIRLIREIGSELDRRQSQPARRAWHDLLLLEASQ